MKTIMPELFIQIGRKRYQVDTLEQASAMFCQARDASGLGCSAIGHALVVDSNGVEQARISYNGRVWPAGGWQPSMKPLFDPR